MPQGEQWRHHYIPKFYLSRWTSKTGTLVQFSKPYGNTVRSRYVYPEQTGFVDRLYEMKGVPPERAHLFETAFFSPVDSMAAAVLAKMEAKRFDFSDRERSAWSDFIVSLTMRTPEMVAGVREHMAEDVAKTPANQRAHFVLPNDKPVDVERAMVELSTPDGIARVAMSTLTRTIRAPMTGEALINLQWGLVYAPIFAPSILTSDRPVYWMGQLSGAEFNLMLPIGPKTIFWAAPWRSYAAAQMNGIDAGALVELLNDHVTRRAAKFVYGLSISALDYVQDRMGVSPPVTLVDKLLDIRRDIDRKQRRQRRGRTFGRDRSKRPTLS